MDTTNPAETCSKQVLNASTVLCPHKPTNFERIKSSRLPSVMTDHYRSAEPHLVSGSTQWRWYIQRRWQHVPQIQ